MEELKHARIVDTVLALLDPQCVVAGIRKRLGWNPSGGVSFLPRCNGGDWNILEVVGRALLENDVHTLKKSQQAGRVRVEEKGPYVAVAACPSNCLLDTGDQSSWDGCEVKAGGCRSLRDSGSDQCRAKKEGNKELHLES